MLVSALIYCTGNRRLFLPQALECFFLLCLLLIPQRKKRTKETPVSTRHLSATRASANGVDCCSAGSAAVLRCSDAARCQANMLHLNALVKEFVGLWGRIS